MKKIYIIITLLVAAILSSCVNPLENRLEQLKVELFDGEAGFIGYKNPPLDGIPEVLTPTTDGETGNGVLNIKFINTQKPINDGLGNESPAAECTITDGAGGPTFQDLDIYNNKQINKTIGVTYGDSPSSSSDKILIFTTQFVCNTSQFRYPVGQPLKFSMTVKINKILYTATGHFEYTNPADTDSGDTKMVLD